MTAIIKDVEPGIFYTVDNLIRVVKWRDDILFADNHHRRTFNIFQSGEATLTILDGDLVVY